jgi:aminomethyltransferase
MKQTALIDEHRRLGGRLIDFGGWELPVQYTGVLDEHTACRTAAGLFDVSHMGEVLVEGPDAEAFLQLLVTNNVAKIAVGQAQYSVMCNERGGIVDDLIVYRRGQDRYLVVVNASNTDKDFDWMREVRAKHGAKLADFRLENVSAEWTQIAIQGRKAQEILSKLTDTPLAPIKYYWFAEGKVLGSIPAILSRTGYTGEDGFEVYVPWSEGPRVWRALLEAGTPLGLKPCGLGARDTLRLEVRYPLYGHELTDDTNPLEAGLGWVTKLDKGEFVGRGPIAAVKENGTTRALVGLRMIDRGIPRQGYPVWSTDGATRIGELTSGTQSPSLGQAIGVAYITKGYEAVGSRVLIEVRGQKLQAEIVPSPFYKRPY